MKKLILSATIVMACLTANAQEPEKKKDSPSPSRGQERAINESGVSVKSESKKSSSSSKQSSAAPASEEKKKEEKTKEAKKPE